MPNINLTLPYIFSVRVHSHFMLSSSHLNLDWAVFFLHRIIYFEPNALFPHITFRLSLCYFQDVKVFQ